MKTFLRRAPLIVVLLLVVGLVAYGFRPEPLAVESSEAYIGTIQVTVNDDGKTRIREKYIVSAPVLGKLFRIELKEGAEVNLDTVLARIEPSDPSLLDARAEAEAKARVRAAEAASKQAEAALERSEEAAKLAEGEYKRAEKLIQQGALPVSEFEEIEHTARMARADVRSAKFSLAVEKFELELARAALVRTQPESETSLNGSMLTIYSPIQGQVLRVLNKDAGVVTPGDDLLEIGHLKDLEMEIDVLSTDAVRIRPGAKVLVEHWGGERPLEGAVRLVEPAAFLKISALGVEEQRVNVIADFTSPYSARKTLGDGYRIEARIVVDEAEDAVVVPTGVLFRDAGKWRVYQIIDDVAVSKAVEIGRTNGVETEITSGLQAGAKLILHPSDKVKDGANVRTL